MVHLKNLAGLAAMLVFPLDSVIAAPNVQPPTELNIRDNKDDKAQPSLPAVKPPPQEISSAGCGVRLNKDVTIVTGDFADEPTLRLLKELVSSAGGKVTIASSSEGKGHGTQILIGTGDDNKAAAEVAEALTGASAVDLDDEGYVLASGKHEGHPTIVLNGVDARGTFYAAQTLRQLLDGGKGVPGVQVRDWPLMPVRGSVEGFYGIPWSHEARLDQYVLYGEHKMNTYIYTPKDDALLRRSWRDLYEGDDLAKMQELIDTANANHVDFTFALSPGNDLCYSSQEDFDATVAKFDQIRDLGVRRFYLALDDIPTDRFHCEADEEKWPQKSEDDETWLAEAQVFYLNRVQEEWIEENDLDALETVPTHYIGSAPRPYKESFGSGLNKNIRIQWTGEDTMSASITVESATTASESYVTENLFIWDNFPVNDMDFSRLFLNPLTERDLDLYKHLIGFTSNPMQQPYASMIALINYGDYTWNGPAYDATESMDAALWELVGDDKKVYEALVAFVDLNQNWPYREPEIFAPQLAKDIKSFWDDDTKPLAKRLKLLATLPETLSDMANKDFALDVKPWTVSTSQWAEACEDLIAMLDALDKGNKQKADKKLGEAKAWIEKTKKKTVETLDREGNPDSYAPNVGDGLFQKFYNDTLSVYEGYYRT